MSSHYRYTPAEAWNFPLTCLTGIHDSYVTAENARSWGRFTRQHFQLFMIDTEHFLVVDHSSFLIAVLNRELTIPL
jgi:surfactin synthase thioesterase subunit